MVNLCLLFIIGTVHSYLNQSPINSKISFTSLSITGILAFILYYRQDLEEEINPDSTQKTEEYKKLQSFKKFSDSYIVEKIFSIFINCSILVVILLILYDIFFATSKNYFLEDFEYNLLNQIGIVLSTLTCSIDYTMRIFRVKFNLILALLYFSAAILIFWQLIFNKSYTY